MKIILNVICFFVFCGRFRETNLLGQYNFLAFKVSVVFFGSGMKDGNGHIKDDLPLVLAGKASGKLKPGSHIRAPKKTQLPELHVTIQQLFGIESNDINGVGKGPISSLI